jgi:hypothetical protein
MSQPSAFPDPNEAFEYQEAVEKLSEWLDHPPRSGSLDPHEFEACLERIAGYVPPSPIISAAVEPPPAIRTWSPPPGAPEADEDLH